MLRKLLFFSASFVLTIVLAAPSALACGFLIADNGAVRLVRTTTFVAWDGEVERYITNFEFASAQKSFGSIIPLPGEPTHVGKAGGWTLQRLDQEVRPPARFDGDAVALSAAEDSGGVEVLLETKVDSLDITVVKGGGDEVAEWADDNGFDIGEGADELLSFYSDRSPYFMAAKFDADRAEADAFTSGDGIPVLVEVPVDRPWVPLHILGFDRGPEDTVIADVFLLTPDQPEMVHGPGLTVNRSEWASKSLLDDLRSDENMEWVPHAGWFTHLELDVAPPELNYDLSVGAAGVSPSLLEAGLTRQDLSADQLEGFGFVTDRSSGPSWWLVIPVALLAGLGGGLFGGRALRRSATVD